MTAYGGAMRLVPARQDLRPDKDVQLIRPTQHAQRRPRLHRELRLLQTLIRSSKRPIQMFIGPVRPSRRLHVQIAPIRVRRARRRRRHRRHRRPQRQRPQRHHRRTVPTARPRRSTHLSLHRSRRHPSRAIARRLVDRRRFVTSRARSLARLGVRSPFVRVERVTKITLARSLARTGLVDAPRARVCRRPTMPMGVGVTSAVVKSHWWRRRLATIYNTLIIYQWAENSNVHSYRSRYG